MTEYTTILVDKDLKAKLDLVKMHPRESYREVIERTLEVYLEEKRIEEFFGRAQMESMKKLWDNKYDKAWERL
jgi:predicted transcriptional regulator